MVFVAVVKAISVVVKVVVMVSKVVESCELIGVAAVEVSVVVVTPETTAEQAAAIREDAQVEAEEGVCMDPARLFNSTVIVAVCKRVVVEKSVL